MKHLLLLSIFLASCSWPTTAIETQELVVPEKTVPQQEALPLETFPSEVSIPYFAKMRLEGTEFTLGNVLTRNDAYTRYTITYKSNGLLISGILNIPSGDGPFPLVVTNHGYIDRSVYTNGRGLKREQDFLARRGFTVLHSDYRGHAESDPSPLPDDHAIYDAGLEYSMDVLNGIYALRAANLLSVDASSVILLGHSLGGGVSMNIAVAYPKEIDALILYAPVHSDAWENFKRWRSRRLEGAKTIDVIGTRESDPEMWDKISALAYLDQLRVPVLLFQGTRDDSVPREWSDFLASKLTEMGKDITYVVYEGEKHEFIAKWNDFMIKVVAFAKQKLKSTSFYTADRVTKKPFGIFITPSDSPVSPERFSGYHTGTDFEVYEGEEEENLAVTALCSGEALYRDWVKGYGGVLVQSCVIEGQQVTVLYGHLAIDSIFYNVGDLVEEGAIIGTLGEGYSSETDGERPHLHLSVHLGRDVELRGYVKQESEISSWLDPMELL